MLMMMQRDTMKNVRVKFRELDMVELEPSPTSRYKGYVASEVRLAIVAVWYQPPIYTIRVVSWEPKIYETNYATDQDDLIWFGPRLKDQYKGRIICSTTMVA